MLPRPANADLGTQILILEKSGHEKLVTRIADLGQEQYLSQAESILLESGAAGDIAGSRAAKVPVGLFDKVDLLAFE